jgi:hypothetical protein
MVCIQAADVMPDLNCFRSQCASYKQSLLCAYRAVYTDKTRASIFIPLDAVQICYATGSRFRWTSINLAPAGNVALLSLPL